MFEDCNRIIFLNILIMQKLYSLFFMKNFVIMFHKNNVNIYLVYLRDFSLKRGKILNFFVKLLWVFLKNF